MLTQESAHHDVENAEFSSNFFRQFDFAMKLKKEELKNRKRQQTGK